MERRLTAQGPKDRKSYMVTLPIDWVKSKNLDKGRIVDLDIIGNTVIITTPDKTEEIVKIDAEKFKLTLDHLLSGLYIMGVNEIRVFYNDKKIIKRIMQILSDYMLGFEVMEHNKDYLLIKNITKESNEEFKTVLRRLFLSLLFLSDEVLRFLKDGRDRDSYNIMGTRSSIYKLGNYCQRLLAKKGHIEYLKVPYYFSLCQELKLACSNYRWFYEEINKNRNSSTWEINMLTKINNNLNNLYNLFYSFDINKYEKGRGSIISLMNILRSKQHRYKYYLLSIADRINALYRLTLLIKFNPEKIK